MTEKIKEACQVFIEQEIDRGLSEGKTPYSVAKEIIPWLQKLFDVRMNPKTIESRAYRQSTSNEVKKSQPAETITNFIPEIIKDRHPQGGGAREGAGRPPVFKVEEPAHRTSFTGDNEWYTPVEYIEAAREVMGTIDIDPATSEFGQSRIRATTFHTVETDGLKAPWMGNVWLNPPYAQPDIFNFIEKAVKEWNQGNIDQAVILTHNYTDTTWFHLAESAAALICFTKGRVKFEKSDGTIAAPTQGSAFFYFGTEKNKFREVFSIFGFIR